MTNPGLQKSDGTNGCINFTDDADHATGDGNPTDHATDYKPHYRYILCYFTLVMRKRVLSCTVQMHTSQGSLPFIHNFNIGRSGVKTLPDLVVNYLQLIKTLFPPPPPSTLLVLPETSLARLTR